MSSRARPIIVATEGPEAYFLRLARGVALDIRRGRLRQGDPLPGTRALAASLGVNRNTVVAAYRELALEGWVVVRGGGGTFVAGGAPDPRPRGFARGLPAQAMARSPGFLLSPEAPNGAIPVATKPGVLVMAGGVPDVRLLPTALLARAYRRALSAPGSERLLAYGDPRGDGQLCAAIARMARETRGVPVSEGNVLVTRGSQMALELVAHAIVPHGGTVAVEGTGYPPAWAAFRRCGARVVPVPVDAHGIVVEALTPLAGAGLSLVYVTPHHQYPTTATLTPSRRAALLDLARRERFAIIEDDYDHELHYDGRPILPLASADPSGHVVYIGTLSKVLAPALRLGYVLAPEPFIERLAKDRFVLDRQGDHVVERATAELLEDGSVARHVRKCRQIYRARRDQLVSGLMSRLGGRVLVRAPSGGMALWAEVDLPAKDVARWESRALERGVSFAAGGRFTFDGRPLPFARFGFAMLGQEEIDRALDRLVRAFPTRA